MKVRTRSLDAIGGLEELASPGHFESTDTDPKGGELFLGRLKPFERMVEDR